MTHPGSPLRSSHAVTPYTTHSLSRVGVSSADASWVLTTLTTKPSPPPEAEEDSQVIRQELWRKHRFAAVDLFHRIAKDMREWRVGGIRYLRRLRIMVSSPFALGFPWSVSTDAGAAGPFPKFFKQNRCIVIHKLQICAHTIDEFECPTADVTTFIHGSFWCGHHARP